MNLRDDYEGMKSMDSRRLVENGGQSIEVVVCFLLSKTKNTMD